MTTYRLERAGAVLDEYIVHQRQHCAKYSYNQLTIHRNATGVVCQRMNQTNRATSVADGLLNEVHRLLVHDLSQRSSFAL